MTNKYINAIHEDNNMVSIIAPKRKFEGVQVEQVEKLGKTISEVLSKRYENSDFYSKREYDQAKEFLNEYAYLDENGVMKEDLTFDDNGALYTTMVANFVDRALRPDLVAAGLIKVSRVDVKGTSGIKVPASVLVTAAALPDSGAVTYASSVNYGSTTITLGWIYAAQKITYELIQQSNIDIISDQLYELGDAIARKVDSDIIAAFETATPSDDANSNYTALGAAATLNFTNLMKGMTDAMTNYASCDSVLLNPTSFYNFITHTDTKTALGYNSVQLGSLFPRVVDVGGMRFVISQQVGANDVYLIDSKRNGWLFEGSGVEVFDGRISGTLAQEVIAAKIYGVGCTRPAALFRLEENEANE